MGAYGTGPCMFPAAPLINLFRRPAFLNLPGIRRAKGPESPSTWTFLTLLNQLTALWTSLDIFDPSWAFLEPFWSLIIPIATTCPFGIPPDKFYLGYHFASAPAAVRWPGFAGVTITILIRCLRETNVPEVFAAIKLTLDIHLILQIRNKIKVASMTTPVV